MTKGLLRIALVGAIVVSMGVAYRVATAKPNEDHRNYEVLFQIPSGWKELPRNPNTLLLARNPNSLEVLRCSATQIVDEINPEPDVDTAKMVEQVVQNARENQPEWKTERLKPYSNGKVDFELYRKTNQGKTVVAAMAVRGNTTLLVSVSNTGAAAKALLDSHASLLAFLDSVDLRETDKWIQIHNKYDDP